MIPTQNTTAPMNSMYFLAGGWFKPIMPSATTRHKRMVRMPIITAKINPIFQFVDFIHIPLYIIICCNPMSISFYRDLCNQWFQYQNFRLLILLKFLFDCIHIHIGMGWLVWIKVNNRLLKIIRRLYP